MPYQKTECNWCYTPFIIPKEYKSGKGNGASKRSRSPGPSTSAAAAGTPFSTKQDNASVPASMQKDLVSMFGEVQDAELRGALDLVYQAIDSNKPIKPTGEVLLSAQQANVKAMADVSKLEGKHKKLTKYCEYLVSALDNAMAARNQLQISLNEAKPMQTRTAEDAHLALNNTTPQVQAIRCAAKVFDPFICCGW